MASIIFLKDRKKNPYKAQVKKKGLKTQVRYFPTREEAVQWAYGIEYKIRNNIPLSTPVYMTYGDLLKQLLRLPKKYLDKEIEFGFHSDFRKSVIIEIPAKE